MPPAGRRVFCIVALWCAACSSNGRVAATSGWWGSVRSNVDAIVPAWQYTRDCGYSAVIPGATVEALWVFCDTARSAPSTEFFTSTAARGLFAPGRAPSELVEQGPATLLGQFLPAPRGLSCPGGYTPPWTNGVTALPGTTRVLVSYVVFCVTASALTPLQFGIATYDTSTRSMVSNAPAVFSGSPLAAMRQLRDPVIYDDGAGDAIYFTVARCASMALGSCATGEVDVARVPMDSRRSWEDPGAYRWWSGTTWSADPSDAVSVVKGATPTATSMQRYGSVSGGPFVLLEQTAVNGAFRVWSAPTPTGPWKLRRGDTAVPECGSGAGFDLCRAIIGHPELSTSTVIAYSAYRPADQRVGVGWFTLDP